MRRRPGLLLIVAGMLAGCEANQLFIAHDTVIGVSAAVNTERSSGHLIVGYDRKFGATIPKSVPIEGTDDREAMAVLSCSDLAVDGIFLQKFTEYLATGDAAIGYAATLAGKSSPTGTQSVDAAGAAGDEEVAARAVARDEIFDCFDDVPDNGRGPR